MADPRFFSCAGPFTLGDLADRTGARLADGVDPQRQVHDVAALDEAGPDAIAFLENRRYIPVLAESRAGACLMPPSLAERAPSGIALLLTDRPRRAFARVARTFYPEPPPTPGAHPSAVVDPAATLGQGCSIGANAVIGPGAEIGERCRIEAGAVVGANVTVGAESVVGAGASLSHCLVGARVVIYPGARIGQPGFGFEGDEAGPVKMPQLGRVIIEDDVEIGANTTVDRGSGPDTVIGRGTMIDNLVQIGHNVQVGRGCIIVSQVGIAGSTKLGDHVVIAGQVGIAGHLSIGDGVQIAAKSGVNRSIPAGAKVGGQPAVPMAEFRRQIAVIKGFGRRRSDDRSID